MRFHLLGPVEAWSGRQPIRLGRRERLVLALLLLGSDRLIPVERLIDAIWTEPPATARQQLHNTIASLRRRLRTGNRDGGDLIVTRPLGYELCLGENDFDLVDFRRLASQGRDLLSSGAHHDATQVLTRALDLWRGTPLADLPEHQADGLRQPLIEEQLTSAEDLLESQLALRRYDEMLAQIRDLLASAPYRERLHELRIRALAATGRRAEALESYQLTRRQFVDALGVEPGPTITSLHTQILDGVAITRVATGFRNIPRQLPAATAVLVGRDRLLAQIVAELQPRRTGMGRRHPVPAAAGTQPGPATVGLVGVGGIGKTALAVAAGHRVERLYPDGTLFAELGGFTARPVNPSDVVSRFLRALGVDQSAIPADPDERVALYRSVLAGSRTLVILDDVYAESQVRTLLPSAPGSAAIVTSRRKLTGLIDATLHTVPRLSSAEAVDVLRTSDPGGDAGLAARAAELCGHLPLALRVASARLASSKDLDLGDLVELLEQARLDELTVGDLDVRPTIAASYDCLSPDARRALRRLGVAAGPEWPAWLAGTAASQSPRGVLDELIDVHLVEPVGRDDAGQPRFRMHALVADFAAERAAAEETTQDLRAIRLDVVRVWLGLATEADELLPHALDHAAGLGGGSSPPAAVLGCVRSSPRAWFESERANLVTAVDTASELGEADLAATLALRFDGFLTIRAYGDDRERVHAKAVDCTDPELRIRVLRARFGLAAQRDRLTELPELAARQLEAARSQPDRGWEQRALTHAGFAARQTDDLRAAAGFLTAAADLGREHGDEGGVVTAEGNLAMVHVELGDPASAEPMLLRAVDHERAAGVSRRTAIWLLSAGICLIELGRHTDAASRLDQAQAIYRTVGDEYGVAKCLRWLAIARVRSGQPDAAQAALELAAPVLDQHTGPPGDPDIRRTRAELEAADRNWVAAVAQLEPLCAREAGVGSRLQLARDLAMISALHAIAGDTARAAAAAQACHSYLEQLGLDPPSLRLPPGWTVG